MHAPHKHHQNYLPTYPPRMNSLSDITHSRLTPHAHGLQHATTMTPEPPTTCGPTPAEPSPQNAVDSGGGGCSRNPWPGARHRGIGPAPRPAAERPSRCGPRRRSLTSATGRHHVIARFFWQTEAAAAARLGVVVKIQSRVWEGGDPGLGLYHRPWLPRWDGFFVWSWSAAWVCLVRRFQRLALHGGEAVA